jgi:hypothetical protein
MNPTLIAGTPAEALELVRWWERNFTHGEEMPENIAAARRLLETAGIDPRPTIPPPDAETLARLKKREADRMRYARQAARSGQLDLPLAEVAPVFSHVQSTSYGTQ